MSTPHEFQHNGQRFDSNAVDLDALAQQIGYPSFAEMQAQSPVMAQALAFQHGGDGGTTYQSAASDDDLHTGRLLSMIALTAGGGALADYFAAGGAAAAGGVNPAAVQAASSLPGASAGAPLVATTGLPAGLPGATTIAAAPAASHIVATAGGGTLSTLLRGAGSAFGAASNADANNTGESNREQLALAQLMLEAQRADESAYNTNARTGLDAYTENANVGQNAFTANTAADNSFQGSLINRGRLEDDQRQRDILNLFKDSKARNPNIGPYDTRGPSALSPEYLAALRNVGSQASTELAHAPVYSAAGMPALNQRVYTPPTPYQAPAPYVPRTFTPPSLQTPGSSTLSRIGQWLGPGLVAASGLVGGR